jgi:hypothetical protein
MDDSIKTAWLVGLYTMDIEERIESLGYKLTRLFTDLQPNTPEEGKPSLIVFSDDRFTSLDSMYIAKDTFPQALLISIPARVDAGTKWIDDDREGQTDSPMERLILSIKEREYRWDN